MQERLESKAFEIVQNHVINKYAMHMLEPGECIFETALADELGLSRTPVRDALGRLVALGLLEQHHQKRGYRVPSLSFDDMREAHEARECLEEKIGALAAEKARSADINELVRINEQESQLLLNKASSIEYMQANNDFHLKLAAITQNRYIERAYEPVYWRTQLYVYHLGPFIDEEERKMLHCQEVGDSPHEHSHIIEAIRNRDAEEARIQCRHHLDATFIYRLSRQYSCPADIFNKLFKNKS